MDDKPSILIIGATGTVGSEVLKAACARGIRTRVLVRSKMRAGEMPAGVDVMEGDLSDPIAVKHSLEGISAAFYVSPHLENEEQVAEQFTTFCKDRSIRMVFVGVHVDGSTRFSRWLKRTAFGSVMRHYKSKIRLSEGVRQSGSDTVILIPTNFYQNDELVRTSLLENDIFAQPLGLKGINRVDVKDIAKAAVRVLTDKSVSAGAYPIVGPESLTGPQCAAVWSKVSGRPVKYCEDDTLWETLVRSQLVGKKKIDILKTYRLIRKFKLPTSPKMVAATSELLGHPPRSYQTYVEETFQQWQENTSD